MPEPLTYTGPLWIPGHPVPKGSMKCVTPHKIFGCRCKGRPMTSRLAPDKRTDPDNWAGRVPQTLALRLPELVQAPLDTPLALIADFHLARPKTTKFPDAPIGHGTGDADKFTRMIGDAMQNAGIITDDSRITEIHAHKLYAPDGKTEGAHVELRPARLAEPTGNMPVRIQTGRVNALVGHIGDPADLPKLLRDVADHLEATRKDET